MGTCFSKPHSQPFRNHSHTPQQFRNQTCSSQAHFSGDHENNNPLKGMGRNSRQGDQDQHGVGIYLFTYLLIRLFVCLFLCWIINGPPLPTLQITIRLRSLSGCLLNSKVWTQVCLHSLHRPDARQMTLCELFSLYKQPSCHLQSPRIMSS